LIEFGLTLLPVIKNRKKLHKLTGSKVIFLAFADGLTYNKKGYPKVMGRMSYFNEQGNVSALVQIFNAIPLPSLSAAAELRMNNLSYQSLICVNPIHKISNLSCSIHPRCLTLSDSLEGRFVKAKSSISLRHFPACLYKFFDPSFWNNANEQDCQHK
jgi:hypothetical protein